MAVVLSGCSPQGDDSEKITPDAPVFPSFVVDPDIPVLADVQYGTTEDGSRLLLDVCLPPTDDTDATAASPPDPAERQVTDDPTTVDGAAPSDPAATPSPLPTDGSGDGTAGSEDAAGSEDGAGSEEGSGAGDGELQQPGSVARPAIVMVHGGSWRQGDKADIPWRSTCQWLAKAGYPVFNIDYRLAPAHVFPAGFDDVKTAVEWVRAPEQLQRFDIDPERIAAFGGSAGGSLVSLLGTSGDGPTDVGARVAAVVELSGPVDLTGRDVTSDFLPIQLSYLGCATESACPQATEASAGTFIDSTDPPFFVAHSTDERIPIAQSSVFVSALRAAGVPVTFVETAGSLHSIAALEDPLRARILQFLSTELTTRSTQPTSVPNP